MKKVKTTTATTFISLLVNEGLIFVAWKIGDSEWKKIMKGGQLNRQKEPGLYLQVYSREDGISCLIEDIPVFGQENKWHLFINNTLTGKRISIRLTYEAKDHLKKIIAESNQIDIPMSDKAISVLFNNENELKLYKLSGALGRWGSSSEATLLE